MRGLTVWLTGVPDSGTPDVAAALAARLRDDGHRVEVLGAEVPRLDVVADLLARNGVKVVVAGPAQDEVVAAARAAHRSSGTPLVEVPVGTARRSLADAVYSLHVALIERGLA